MRRVIDTLSGDLFATVPKAHPMTPGGWRFRAEIAHAMGEAIRTCDKDIYAIAADMSRLLGREITHNTLYKYASEASEEHIPNLETAIAFDAATGQMALITFYAGKLGCRAIPGKDSLLTELGRYEQMKSDISRRERVIKKLLGEEK